VGKNPAYVYYFDHRTPATPDGATHGAEIPYVFGNLDTRPGSPAAAEATLSDRMMNYWVNFAKSGDPNGAGLPTWPVFTENTQQVMYFDGTVAPKPVPNAAQLQALNEYYSYRRAEAQKR
jgi:para-nitrobenzyl esterase